MLCRDHPDLVELREPLDPLVILVEQEILDQQDLR